MGSAAAIKIAVSTRLMQDFQPVLPLSKIGNLVASNDRSESPELFFINSGGTVKTVRWDEERPTGWDLQTLDKRFKPKRISV